jgi:hypothetical protein
MALCYFHRKGNDAHLLGMSSNMKNIRDFATSAEARAAGFTTLQWLRAFTFNEHAARIERDRAYAGPKWWEVEAQ